MRESWAFINCHPLSRKSVLRNLRRSCAASSRKRWKISRTDARLEAFSLVDTWRKDTGTFRRTFPCEEWNKGRESPRPSSWSQWCIASFGTGTKRSEQRPGRAMSRLTDKIRSNGNPFATPSSSLLRFHPFGDSSHQFSAFSFRLQFPEIRLASRLRLSLLAASVQSAMLARNCDLTLWKKWRIITIFDGLIEDSFCCVERLADERLMAD